ncbi:MAG TPA: aldehyde dehydrogenase family protein, partial [Polyangiaceae bacterium]|nr:aldehyde dehydrogenase family protein [Polyangiaceae bacterium]
PSRPQTAPLPAPANLRSSKPEPLSEPATPPDQPRPPPNPAGSRIKGAASDPTSEMGPLIDKPNVERVNRMVEEALAEGARAVVRGGPVTDGPLARGAFYRPSLIEVTDPKMTIVSYGAAGGTRAVEQLRLVMAELQVATVRAQVALSLFADFENFSEFTPGAHHMKSLDTMLDQLVAWSNALAPLRTG